MPLEGSVAGFAARAADAAIQAPGSLPRRVPAGPRIEARPRFEASIGGHASMNKLVHAGPRIEAPDPRIEAPMVKVLSTDVKWTVVERSRLRVPTAVPSAPVSSAPVSSSVGKGLSVTVCPNAGHSSVVR